MTTYSKITRNGQVTLPSSIRKKLGVDEGDIVEIEIVNDTVVLVPKKLIDMSQAYFWSKKWQAGELEAEQDIHAGRVKTFNTAEELIKDLDS
jgi:AbrB family looped-hinge helix DNA binding protein